MDAGDALVGLLRSIEQVYRASMPGLPTPGPLTVAADRIAGIAATDLRIGTGRRKPVSRFARQAVDLGRRGPLSAIASAFAAAEPRVDWLQNPNYSVESMGPGFVERYGYVELVGPGRAAESRDLLVGLLLLGPETHYPDHVHPAEEIYHVVGGRAEWWREDEGWREKPPGAVIHHAPMVRHAMRATAEPLLALYCWTGRIEVHARMTGASAWGGNA
ncbi:MAG: cupin domain-containing protein [Alphaproteobacteria bacterium]|nr:cupin domain-containing protein [Alphaproteobacteria bacterium]